MTSPESEYDQMQELYERACKLVQASGGEMPVELWAGEIEIRYVFSNYYSSRYVLAVSESEWNIDILRVVGGVHQLPYHPRIPFALNELRKHMVLDDLAGA